MKTVVHSLDERPTLEEAQTLVGGFVELVQLSPNHQLLVDEDGKAKQKPYNPAATFLTRAFGLGHVIAGDAVFLSFAACWRDDA